MADQLFVNSIKTTLAVGIDASQTSMQVTSATGFPAPAGSQFFMIAIYDQTTGALKEVVKCTAVAGVTCTITRAQEGSTGTSATAGDILIVSPVTKGTLETLQTAIEAAAVAELASGTTILCGDDAAPSGWTKVAAWQDGSQLVFTTGATSEGGTDSATAFDPNVTVGNHASHTHTIATHRHVVADHLHQWYNYRLGTHQSYDISGAAENLVSTSVDYGVHIYMVNGGIVGNDHDMYTNLSGPGYTDYSGALTSGGPSATLTHSVAFNQYAPKYRYVTAITKN